MTQFQRNDRSFIRKLIDEEVDRPNIGRVSEVYEHAGVDDDSNFEVDIELDARTESLSRVQVASSFSDGVSVPKVGDKVIVHYLEDGKPVVTDTVWTNKDRPPVGLSGMHREQFDSGESGGGGGDLFITGYTEYDERAATAEKPNVQDSPEEQAAPQKAVVQIAKHEEGANTRPTDDNTLPGKVEFYDSPKDGESYISVEINEGADGASEVPWGIRFNIESGEWQLVDENGFGMTCDGDGNFMWYGKTLNHSQPSGDTGPLSLD